MSEISAPVWRRSWILRYPLASRFVALALVLIAALVLVVGHLQRKASLPPFMQVYPPASLSPISIERDLNGVAHLHARTDDDAYFAIGYAQAQDRLWQLEMLRRTMRGETSEVLGKDALSSDVWYRSLGLESTARTAWPALSAKAQHSLQRFVDGINVQMESRGDLPLEFKLFDIRPQRWTVFDALARFKLFAFEYSGDFHRELAREAARRNLPTPSLHAVFPELAEPGSEIAKDRGDALEPEMTSINRLQSPWETSVKLYGSAWAVSGSQTRRGPLLSIEADDELRIPSTWYMMQVDGGSLAVAGMSLVGVPLVIFGRNRQIAWGGTALPADTQDIYFENTDPNGATTYQSGDQWVKFHVRREVVTVRRERAGLIGKTQWQSVPVTLRDSDKGPVISDEFAEFGEFGRPFSLRWIGFDPGDTSYEAFYKLQFAPDWMAFRTAMSALVTPPMDMVYADLSGHVGALCAGRIPIRKSGKGYLPAAGWQDSAKWAGYIPFDRLPAVFDPPAGYVVAAHQPAGDPGQERFDDGAESVHADRIASFLRKDLEIGHVPQMMDVADLQADDFDESAAALAARLSRQTYADGPLERSALAALKSWRGNMDAADPASLVFSVWTQQLRSVALRADWSAQSTSFGLRSTFQHVDEFVDNQALMRLLETCSASPPSGAPTGKGADPNCRSILSRTLTASLDQIARIAGTRRLEDWRGLVLQRGRYRHGALGGWQALGGLFERASGQSGGRGALHSATWSFADNRGLEQTGGPTFRQLISVDGDGWVQEFANSTGQSGDPLSANYADMVGLLERGEYLRLDSLGDRAEHTPPSAASAVAAAQEAAR